jgi:DNA topoisomerase-1
MIENLVIVESPAKARTIERFLGKDFHVKSSFGHIRDLAKKNLGIELDNKYEPIYIISEDKKKIVAELKKIAGEAKIVWLASDEDREGEAIAWHLSEVLNLKPENTKRIVFHEITKSAIQAAIRQPRGIDQNLVNSQQARRVLDRLVGFELSPILWKKIQPSLSAGRVQSVAVRLLVEREREILSFKPTRAYKIEGIFIPLYQDGQERSFKAEIPKRFPSKQKTLEFLNKNKDAEYVVINIEVKPTKRWPPPPFTTSTLQQEASWKLGFSVTQTMLVAQKLYEAGKITYMRTDSVNLSNLALSTAKKAISNEFGNEYIKIRKYKTKAKGAQEAHEAIRPTYLQNKSIDGAVTEKKLYELIWKRTIASQMSDALLEKTVATIDVSTTEEDFIATGEVIKFDGFLRVYTESKNEEAEGKKKNILPPLNINQTLTNKSILGIEKFTQPQSRYTEASLVKNLEELGIGRPSTYAPTISTIQNRGYVVKEDRPGSERKINLIRLENKVITEEIQTEFVGREKGKLFPNDIGMIVNDFLVDHFKDIINYNFTAKVEKEFDEIALGKLDWTEMIDEFYQSFHKKVEETLKHSEKKTGERILGEDPVTRLTVLVKMGRYGPVAQLGDTGKDKKPRFARLLKGQLIETITLEEALNLFKLPRTIGAYEENEVIIGVGKFGPYIRHNDKFYSLKKGIDDPLTIEIERAKELIEEKRKSDRKKVIKTFSEDPNILILKGRYGPYLSYKKKNYRIPKAKDPGALSYEESLELIKKGQKSKTKNK